MIRTRMTADSNPSMNASSSIYRSFISIYGEGVNRFQHQSLTSNCHSNILYRLESHIYGVKNLYYGFQLALFGVVLYKGLHLGGYDFFKEVLSSHLEDSSMNSFAFAYVSSIYVRRQVVTLANTVRVGV